MPTPTELLGPYRPEQDLALTGPLAQDPAAIETFNIWFYDGDRGIGFNLHPHAHNGTFSAGITVFLPDGRVVRGEAAPAPFTDPAAPGNGLLTLRCVEPFQRWTWELTELDVMVTSLAEQSSGRVPLDREPTSRVSLRLDATMVAPPWAWGELLPESREANLGPPGLWIANRLTAGPAPGVAYRYDQALRATGTVTVDGEEFAVDGAGLRGHVRGVRIMAGFGTHNWMGAVFPSGTAFGANTMFRTDEGFHTNEGYLYRDGAFHPARVLWATQLDPHGDQETLVVELAGDSFGKVRITGRDRSRLWRVFGPTGFTGFGLDTTEPRLMSQAVASYELDGEIGYGMDERSCWGDAGLTRTT